MVRFGLIGCGTHARWAVLPALAEAEGCTLCAAADIVPENMEAIADPAVRRYVDYRRMLEAEELDAVYVATPCEAHCPATVAALEAGCHVVCEKPMGMDAAECERMLSAAEAAGRLLAIDFENRYQPAYRQLRAWIDAGHLGTVRAVHLDHLWDGHKTFGPLAERRHGFLQRSGCLDCGIHSLDLARYFTGGGAWREVYALGAWCGEEVTYAPHIAILARLEPEIIVTLNASFAFTANIAARAQYEGLAILGDRGVITRDRDAEGNAVFVLTSDSLEDRCLFADSGHSTVIPRLLEDFCAAIAGAPLPPSLATGVDGLHAQRAVDAANQAALAHRLEDASA